MMRGRPGCLLHVCTCVEWFAIVTMTRHQLWTNQVTTETFQSGSQLTTVHCDCLLVPRKYSYLLTYLLSCHIYSVIFCKILTLKVWGWLIGRWSWQIHTHTINWNRLMKDLWCRDVHIMQWRCTQRVSVTILQCHVCVRLCNLIPTDKTGTCSVLASLKPGCLALMRPWFSNISAGSRLYFISCQLQLCIILHRLW